MKRLAFILAAAAAAASFSSCGTTSHLAYGYDVDDIQDVILFEPASKIETIGKGEIRVTDETACIESQELLLQTLKTYDTGLNINTVYTPESPEEYDDIRKDIEYLYAQIINSSNGHESTSLLVPARLDKIIENTGKRYGMAVYGYGFSRTRGNYAAEIAKGVGMALLTLGSVYTVPYKDKSNIYIFIMDSEENRIAWYNFDIAGDYNPLKPKHIEKQYKRLFKQFRK